MRVVNVGIVAIVALAVRCQALGKSQVCETCQSAIRTGQAWLATPQAAAFIVQVLGDNLCTEFSKPTENQCRSILPVVLPAVIGIFERWEPRVLCEDIDLCVSSNATNLQLQVAMAAALGGESNAVPCPLCQLAIATVKAQLSDPGNQKYIWDEANKVRSICRLN
jgi:hypothetical protein